MAIENTEGTPSNEPVTEIVEETPIETPAEETPANEVAQTEGQEDDPEVEVSADDAEQDPEEYVPNTEYTVLGKKHTFPEEMKAFIKDKASEDTFRELFEKAGAMDHMKSKNQSLSTEFSTVSEELNAVKGGIEELRTHYSRNDFDSFFGTLKISEEKVLQWAIEKIQYYQMPEEQRREVDLKKQQAKQMFDNQRQSSTREKNLEDYVARMKQREIRQTLGRQDIEAYAKDFDTRAGKEGAFLDEMNLRAERAWQMGNDITAEEAASQIMKLYPMQGNNSPAQNQGAGKKPPVIPTVKGKTTSPVRSTPRSLEDLIKIREQKFG